MRSALQFGVLLTLVACSSGEGERGRLARMLEQPRYDPYERSDFFADGKVLQLPPAGTVPIGSDVGRDAGARVVSPAVLRLGGDRFAIFCAACHGAGGYGGSIVAMNMSPPRPPSLRVGHAAALPPDRIYDAITNGIGRMPSLAAELPSSERWAVVAYLQTLQRNAVAATADARADSIRGAVLQRRDSTARADSARRADSLSRAPAGR